MIDINLIRENPEEMKRFNRLEYHFEEELSSDKEYVFLL